ncbi:MAG: hypothetical protein PUE01_10150 [Clostridiaceae bacterium]|nr:hypothetical protein [Clostridiaceae bacterium]
MEVTEATKNIINNLTIIILAVITIVNYVFSALAFYKIAKLEKYNKPWFAWIPVLNDYLIIKLGEGKILFLVVSILSLIAGSPATYILTNGAFETLTIIVNAIWLAYKIYMYSRIIDRYDENVMIFVVGFILQLIPSMMVFGVIVTFVGHIMLYIKVCKGIPQDKVIIQTRIVSNNRNKKKK